MSPKLGGYLQFWPPVMFAYLRRKLAAQCTQPKCLVPTCHMVANAYIPHYAIVISCTELIHCSYSSVIISATSLSLWVSHYFPPYLQSIILHSSTSCLHSIPHPITHALHIQAALVHKQPAFKKPLQMFYFGGNEARVQTCLQSNQSLRLWLSLSLAPPMPT